jgi:hypothetical protein
VFRLFETILKRDTTPTANAAPFVIGEQNHVETATDLDEQLLGK